MPSVKINRMREIERMNVGERVSEKRIGTKRKLLFHREAKKTESGETGKAKINNSAIAKSHKLWFDFPHSLLNK